jgi:REP element-mobilizing transposase RayT
MSDRFQNKYRIESTRLKNWDYGWNAPYFVTICTQNRECFFGDVVGGDMVLIEIGKIANDCWLEIPEHFPFVKLGEHVVMPNHIHGIVVIDKTDDGRSVSHVETRLIASLPTEPTKTPGGITGNKNPMIHDNLSKIIRWYKGRTSFESRKIHTEFAWQPRFHEHIIRNDQSFQKITEYIINNPLNWSSDQFYI